MAASSSRATQKFGICQTPKTPTFSPKDVFYQNLHKDHQCWHLQTLLLLLHSCAGKTNVLKIITLLLSPFPPNPNGHLEINPFKRHGPRRRFSLQYENLEGPTMKNPSEISLRFATRLKMKLGSFLCSINFTGAYEVCARRARLAWMIT